MNFFHLPKIFNYSSSNSMNPYSKDNIYHQLTINRVKYPDFSITDKDIIAFARLLNDDAVRRFLNWDSCCMLADKYLLAFVLTYFKRANLTHGAWSPCYFFVALYLAHDMEEDDFDLKNDLIRFGMESLGYSRVGQIETKIFMQRRSKLWHQLDMRTAVNHVCCEEIMKYVLPNNRIWKRERNSDHGGIAIPWRMKSQVHKELGLASSYYECNINCIICEFRKFSQQNLPEKWTESKFLSLLK